MAKNNRGQVLVIVILLLAVALITVPLLVKYVQYEGKWTIKQSRSTTAYHLAEAGQDRAIWYLVQSTGNWSRAVSGESLAGYCGDVQYSDMEGGLYTINITSGPMTSEVTVVTKGIDSSNNEVRAVKAIYSGSAFQSGFVAKGGIEYKPNFNVHWGQVTSYTNIELANQNAPRYPAKDSAGEIDPWDTDSNPPNSDSNYNYVSFDDTLSYPEIDFDYYRTKSKLTQLPDPASVSCGGGGGKGKKGGGGGSNGGQSAEWQGTGYFDGTGEVKFKCYNVECSTCVIFIESGKVKIEDTASDRAVMRLEALIVYSQNIHIHSNGADPYDIAVPTDAWKQYTAGTPLNPTGPGDTAAVDEYPGDGGYHVVKTTYTAPVALFDGSGNTGVAFHGFMYTYEFHCSGGNNILVGQFNVGSGGTQINTMTIYYDPSIAQNVHYEQVPISRVSWDEIVSDW